MLGRKAEKEQAGRRHARGRDFVGLWPPQSQVRQRGQRTRAGTSREVLPARQLLHAPRSSTTRPSREKGGTTRARRAAEFKMGKTLYKLKFFSAPSATSIASCRRVPRIPTTTKPCSGWPHSRRQCPTPPESFSKRSASTTGRSWRTRSSRPCATSCTSCSASTTTTKNKFQEAV